MSMSDAIKRKLHVPAAIYALAFSVLTAFPLKLIDPSLSIVSILILCLGEVFFCYVILVLIAKAIELINTRVSKNPCEWSSGSLLIGSFLVLETVYLAVLLTNYPGFSSVDSVDIINQALGNSSWSVWHRYSGLSSHHPVFYTFCFYIVHEITAGFNDINTTIFTFLVLQITYVAFCLSIGIAWLKRTEASSLLVVAVLVFFATSPVMLAHVAIIWKDIPFSATLILFMLHLASLRQYSESNPPSVQWFVVYFCLSLLVTLLRNNGIYICLVADIYLIIAFKPLRSGVVAITAASLGVILLLNGPIAAVMGISRGHFSESVGVPIQQVGAVIQSNGNISDSDKAVIDSIMPASEWGELYNPDIANPIKFSPEFNDEYLDAHKVEFMGMYLNVFVHNAKTCIKAWLELTLGYFQPGSMTRIGFRSADTPKTTFDGQPVKSLLPFQIDGFEMANDIKSLFPWVFGFGSYIWLILAAFVVDFSLRRRYSAIPVIIAPYIPLIVLFLTLMVAVPTSAEYRYVLALYMALPFVFFFAVHQDGIPLDTCAAGLNRL